MMRARQSSPSSRAAMSDDPETRPPAIPELQARLTEVAQLLHRPGSLDPVSKQALAELVAELSQALANSSAPAPEVAHMAQSTAHLAESLHPQPNTGLLGSAR